MKQRHRASHKRPGRVEVIEIFTCRVAKGSKGMEFLAQMVLSFKVEAAGRVVNGERGAVLKVVFGLRRDQPNREGSVMAGHQDVL